MGDGNVSVSVADRYDDRRDQHDRRDRDGGDRDRGGTGGRGGAGRGWPAAASPGRALPCLSDVIRAAESELPVPSTPSRSAKADRQWGDADRGDGSGRHNGGGGGGGWSVGRDRNGGGRGGDPGDEEHRRSRPRTRGGGGGRDGDHGRRGRRFRWTRADGVSSRGRSGKATMDAWYASVERATALEGLAAAADVFADGGNDGSGGGGSGDLGDGALELGGGAVVSADQDAAWGPGGDGWLGVASVLPVGHWARDHVEGVALVVQGGGGGGGEVLRETVGLLGLLAARVGEDKASATSAE
ncbi:hypothetical protein MMPV_001868 [Pyropia vietnamensis]